MTQQIRFYDQYSLGFVSLFTNSDVSFNHLWVQRFVRALESNGLSREAEFLKARLRNLQFRNRNWGTLKNLWCGRYVSVRISGFSWIDADNLEIFVVYYRGEERWMNLSQYIYM